MGSGHVWFLRRRDFQILTLWAGRYFRKEAVYAGDGLAVKRRSLRSSNEQPVVVRFLLNGGRGGVQ